MRARALRPATASAGRPPPARTGERGRSARTAGAPAACGGSAARRRGPARRRRSPGESQERHGAAGARVADARRRRAAPPRRRRRPGCASPSGCSPTGVVRDERDGALDHDGDLSGAVAGLVERASGREPAELAGGSGREERELVHALQRGQLGEPARARRARPPRRRTPRRMSERSSSAERSGQSTPGQRRRASCSRRSRADADRVLPGRDLAGRQRARGAQEAPVGRVRQAVRPQERRLEEVPDRLAELAARETPAVPRAEATRGSKGSRWRASSSSRRASAKSWTSSSRRATSTGSFPSRAKGRAWSIRPQAISTRAKEAAVDARSWLSIVSASR